MSKRAPLTFDAKNLTPPPGAASAAKTQQQNEQTDKHANTKTSKRATPGREGRQFLAAHVLPEAAKQFKVLAAQQARTTQSMLIEAINDLFAKYGLSRLADE